MSSNPWKIKTTKEVYKNSWITVDHSEVLDPNGEAGIYGVVRFVNQAIGILVIDDDDYTYLVGQYRFPLEQYSWEIPEGGCPPGEDPLDCAKRELLEETGITAQSWTPLLNIHTSNSVCDESGTCYLAKSLSFGKAMPESTELLQTKKLPFKVALQMVMDNEITDSLSIAAILKYALINKIVL